MAQVRWDDEEQAFRRYDRALQAWRALRSRPSDEAASAREYNEAWNALDAAHDEWATTVRTLLARDRLR